MHINASEEIYVFCCSYEIKIYAVHSISHSPAKIREYVINKREAGIGALSESL